MTKGQALVLYDGDTVIGGGTVTAVFREDRCSNGDLTSEQNVLTILPEVQ